MTGWFKIQITVLIFKNLILNSYKEATNCAKISCTLYIAIKLNNTLHQLPDDLRTACIRGETAGQKKLYYGFYGFAMGICLRYAQNRDEAVEILNDGFYKVLTRLERYDPDKPFLPWLARIMTNTAIDHYRSEMRHPITSDISEMEIYGAEPVINSKLNYEDLIALIQELPHGYRTVFNLYAIDGYTHEEIAGQLGISIGTSKSNLFKARQKLRAMLDLQNTPVSMPIENNNGVVDNERIEPKPDRQLFQAGT